MPDLDIDLVIAKLEKACKAFSEPIVTVISKKERDPFRVLIATLLSLRTRDEQTNGAAARLFALASNPRDMALLDPERIEQAIFPVGFYRVKARRIRQVCRLLNERYGGSVPDDIAKLLELPGVGRKTANLVLTRGFGKPGICVDTHVHRISNRLGYVSTRTPEETEMALREKLPERYWIIYNDLLVAFGQNVCVPLSPKCSICPLKELCPRIGVRRHR